MMYEHVHPFVIDVYIGTLSLSDLGRALDGYERMEIDPPYEFQEKLEEEAAKFAFLEERAIASLGSRSALNAQLYMLQMRRGNA